MIYSNEQLLIINDKTNNIIVNAVAGSGKTTTISGVCNVNLDKKILVLTYNNLLAKESRAKIKMKHVEIQTIHGFCTKYYDVCYNDIGMDKIIFNNTKIKNTNLLFDIIIIDEAQDIDPQLFQILIKIFKDTSNNFTRFIFLGDYYQCIYEDMKGSNGKYLTKIDEIISNTFNNLLWKRYYLNITYRCTPEICDLVKRFSRGKINMISNKRTNADNNIIYAYLRYDEDSTIRRQSFDYNPPVDNNNERIDTIANFITKEIIIRKYRHNDIYILFASVSSTSQKKKLYNIIANDLAQNNINTYVKEDNMITIEEISNKVSLNTFYTVKGSERKVVFIVGFDDSYYEYFKKCEKNENNYIYNSICDCNRCAKRHKLPNELYVALTRATHRTYIIHTFNRENLHFVNDETLEKCIIKYNKIPRKKISNNISYNRSVSYYLKHLNIKLDVINMFDYAQIGYKIDTNNINFNKDTNTVENVSSIIGTTIPILYEHYKAGELRSDFISKCKIIHAKIIKEDTNLRILLAKKGLSLQIYDINFAEPNIQDIIKIAKLQQYSMDNLKNIYTQSNNYDIIDDNIKNNSIKNIDALGITKFRTEIEYSDKHIKLLRFPSLNIVGVIDMIYINNIGEEVLLEFKFTDTITESHMYQLLFYKYLREVNGPACNKYSIYNIKTGVLATLKPITLDDTYKILKKIVDLKRHNESQNSTLFVEKNIILRDKVINNNDIIYESIIDPIIL